MLKYKNLEITQQRNAAMRCIDIINKNRTCLFLQFIQFFHMFGEDMFPHKLRTFELLSTEWTQPLVLCQLLRVRCYKLLYFRNVS